MRLRRLQLSAVLLVSLTSSAAVGQIFVDDDAPGDLAPNDPTLGDPLEDGSQLHPFDSLAEAIAAVPDFGLILVQPGRYAGPGNRDIVTGKSFWLDTLRGADETLVDLEHEATFLTLTIGSPYAVISGLTIANGSGRTAGAIETLSTQTELLIESSVLRDNVATGSGVAGGALLVRGSLQCSSTAFLGNASAGMGGAVAIAGDSRGSADHEFTMCTFRGNTAAGDGGAIWAEGTAAAPVLARSATACVFWDNQALGGSQHQIGEALPGNFHVGSTDIQGGWPGVQGSGNLDVDPLFAFSDGFHLSVATPVLELTGGLSCTIGPYDADGQQRDCGGTELGADEVLPVTLAAPANTQAAQVELAVAGVAPGTRVIMLAGFGLATPAIDTVFGSLEIQLAGLVSLPMHPAGAAGTSVRRVDVAGLPAGTDLVFQALVGTGLVPATTLEVQ